MAMGTHRSLGAHGPRQSEGRRRRGPKEGPVGGAGGPGGGPRAVCIRRQEVTMATVIATRPGLPVSGVWEPVPGSGSGWRGGEEKGCAPNHTGSKRRAART